MGLKVGGAVPLSRSAGNASNTTWPARRSTSVPSGVFIHPAVWPYRIGCYSPRSNMSTNYYFVVEMHTLTVRSDDARYLLKNSTNCLVYKAQQLLRWATVWPQ